MFQIIRSNQRGIANHGWLQSFHTFSFADYYNEKMMGFSSLRVLNEDIIEAKMGFPTHGHKDMEIITYVIDGALEHRDSMGNSTVIKPGEVQRMSAGTGVKHSEYNQHGDRSTHLLQIWIIPNILGLEPSYDQRDFSKKLEESDFTLVVSEKGEDSSISIQQNMKLYVCKKNRSGSFIFNTQPQKKYWVQIVKGELNLSSAKDNVILNSGDALALSLICEIKFDWSEAIEMLFFELI